MGSRSHLDASLWNLYCFMEIWGYTFNPPIRKMTKRSHDVNEKGYLSSAICLFLVVTAFLFEFENLLNYLWRKDLSFFSLLIKLSGLFNLSILRISSPFIWWYSLLFCVGQMRHQNIYLVKSYFFFVSRFSSQTLTIHRTAGEGTGPSLIPLHHFHPLTNIETFISNYACEMAITYF